MKPFNEDFHIIKLFVSKIKEYQPAYRSAPNVSISYYEFDTVYVRIGLGKINYTFVSFLADKTCTNIDALICINSNRRLYAFDPANRCELWKPLTRFG